MGWITIDVMEPGQRECNVTDAASSTGEMADRLMLWVGVDVAGLASGDFGCNLVLKPCGYTGLKAPEGGTDRDLLVAGRLGL